MGPIPIVAARRGGRQVAGGRNPSCRLSAGGRWYVGRVRRARIERTRWLGAALALALVACAAPAVPEAPEPRVTPLPRRTSPPPATPSASARPTPTPTPAPAGPPTPTTAPRGAGEPSAPTPFVPRARLALEATFRRLGVAAVRQIVTAEWDGVRATQAGVTDGQGFVRLVLPEIPLPATYRLAVGGRAAGTLFLAAGARPRVSPQAGWAVVPGLATEPE